MSSKFINTVKRFIDQKSLLNKDSHVLVALSGGADSVCLLLLLAKLQYKVTAVHCNFRLRGEESLRDENFVRDLCLKNGIKLYVRSFDTHQYAVQNKISIEMAARDLRYAYFEQLRNEIGADAIAVAHHRDDSVETFIMNAVRGTGIRGLGSIQPRNGYVIRPFLCVSHDEILCELQDYGQQYVTDSTNYETVYTRNKVRLDIVPLLRSLNSSASENIFTTIMNMQETLKIYNSFIEEMKRKCVSEENDACIVSMTQIRACISPVSVLYEILSEKGFNRNQVCEMLDITDSGRTFISSRDDTDNHVNIALIDRNRIIIRRKSSDDFEIVGLSDYPNIKVSVVDVSDVEINSNPRFAYIDEDKVKGHLFVRKVEPGDKFRPFGMKGFKLVNDLLTDMKVDVFQKQQQLILCDEQSVVWVVGRRSSEDYRIDSSTRKVLVLESLI
ncbi:MAG: tRNA lysidine(34) synthetase TilS [Bacteroidaceae bacterium]|nr:tRNA lysidine(34) synthetase TilS [Bacteroidaceae bacterium]